MTIAATATADDDGGSIGIGSSSLLSASSNNQNDNNNRAARRPLLIYNHNPKAGGESIRDFLNEIKPNRFGLESYQMMIQMTKTKNSNSNSNNNNNNHVDVITDELLQRDELLRIVDRRKNITNDKTKNKITVNNTHIVIPEFGRTTIKDKRYGCFIIGSIREPCSQYVSLWSFGSSGEIGVLHDQLLGRGKFKRRNNKNNNTAEGLELYGKHPPYFNTTDDIKRFRNWLEHPLVKGIVGDRVKRSYSKNPLYNNNDRTDYKNIANRNVDCWIVVENFQQSLLHCLIEFHKQGGYIDWKNPKLIRLKRTVRKQILKKMQQQQQERDKNNHHRSVIMESEKEEYEPPKKSQQNEYNSSYSKSSVLNDPRTNHHGKCSSYFRTATGKEEENIVSLYSPNEGKEKFIYEQFGYDDCCTPGNNYINSQKRLLSKIINYFDVNINTNNSNYFFNNNNNDNNNNYDDNNMVLVPSSSSQIINQELLSSTPIILPTPTSTFVCALLQLFVFVLIRYRNDIAKKCCYKHSHQKDEKNNTKRQRKRKTKNYNAR